MGYRTIYTALVAAQELLLSKRLFLVTRSGDHDKPLDAMETVERVEPRKGPSADDGRDEPYVYRRQIVWFNAIGFLVLHLAAVYGGFLLLTSCMILTGLWMGFLSIGSALCVTMGAHRLYTHRTFKCNNVVRAIMVLGQTVAGQNCLYVWIRDHRQHHKYSDTDGDPHNASRGFFFSHVGWLMVRKHRDVIEKGKKIDMSDIEMDSYVMFQKKYYNSLFTVLAVIIPSVVPHFLWGETLWNGFFVCFLFRLMMVLNLTWLVNSAAHLYGNKPFTNDIYPVENVYVSLIGLGEGWHNYHHSFPWDYRAAEFGQYFNLTTKIIDYLEERGWVWDKKCATQAMVRSRAIKRGDGTHCKYGGRPGAKESVSFDGDEELLPDQKYEELFWQEERSSETARDELKKG